MEEKLTQVEMTEQERLELEEFRAHKAKLAEQARMKEERASYTRLVDEELARSIPNLQSLSEALADTKSQIYANFQSLIDMKCEMLKVDKDNQRSHMFTSSDGTKRITLGVYVIDTYLDTVEEGIAIVRDYLNSLAGDATSKSLVDMVLRLLAKDAKGSLKASRIIQLRKIADESGNERLIEGVSIIEQSYRPTVSKQYVKAEVKDESGAWKAIPLGMTES